MAVQLVLNRPVAAPAAQLRISWQGVDSTDQLMAHWSDARGGSRWEGVGSIGWLLQDPFRAGEWKLNLTGIPTEVDRLVLQVRAVATRSVSVVVTPLGGAHGETLVHPGAQLDPPGSPTDLLEFARAGREWRVTGVVAIVGEPIQNDSSGRGSADRFSTGTHQRLQRLETGEQPVIAIPPRLESLVAAARTGRRTDETERVSVLVDVSASMRVWIEGGQLANVLTAVQAVAGAQGQSTVPTWFHPVGQSFEIALTVEPSEPLQAVVNRAGSQTGDRRMLLDAARRGAADGSGVQVVVTDDESLATAGVPGSVVVVVGPEISRLSGPGVQARGPVESRTLARVLAREVEVAGEAVRGSNGSGRHV
jgi:hypothetical protein